MTGGVVGALVVWRIQRRLAGRRREQSPRDPAAEPELREKAQYIANNPRKRWPELDTYPWVREWKDLLRREAAEARTDA